MKLKSHEHIWTVGDLIQPAELPPWHAVNEALSRFVAAMQYFCTPTRPDYPDDLADKMLRSAIDLFVARLALASGTTASVEHQRLRRLCKAGVDDCRLLWARIQLGMKDESAAGVT